METIALEHNAFHRRTNINSNLAEANVYWNRVFVLLTWKTGLHNSTRKENAFCQLKILFFFLLFIAFQRWFEELEVELP